MKAIQDIVRAYDEVNYYTYKSFKQKYRETFKGFKYNKDLYKAFLDLSKYIKENTPAVDAMETKLQDAIETFISRWSDGLDTNEFLEIDVNKDFKGVEALFNEIYNTNKKDNVFLADLEALRLLSESILGKYKKIVIKTDKRARGLQMMFDKYRNIREGFVDEIK